MAIFTNQATLSYQNTVTNSNVTTGEILEALSASKTAVTEQYAVGGDVTYAISLVNANNSAVSGLTVSDNLGSYTVGTETFRPLTYSEGSARLFVNGVLQGPPAVTAGENLVFTGINLPAGGNALILYEATVNGTANPNAGAVITNTATVSGGNLTSPITVSETVTAGIGAQPTITKSVSPSVITENSRITYTFLLQNFGNEATSVEGGAVVSDTFNPILSDLAVTYNGSLWTLGTEYQYNPTTGLFTTTQGAIVIPAGSFEQNPTTGLWETTPGIATLTVTGTV